MGSGPSKYRFLSALSTVDDLQCADAVSGLEPCSSKSTQRFKYKDLGGIPAENGCRWCSDVQQLVPVVAQNGGVFYRMKAGGDSCLSIQKGGAVGVAACDRSDPSQAFVLLPA